MTTIINRLAVDLSHYNDKADPERMWKAGLRSVIHKASESDNSSDDKYAKRRTDFLASDLNWLWGAYHFGRGTPIKAQLERFLASAKLDANTGPFLDWEVVSMSPTQMIDFLGSADNLIGLPMGLYSYTSFLEEWLPKLKPADITFLLKRPLWIARYGTPPTFGTPILPWKEGIYWQYSDGQNGPQPHLCDGITGDVDSNHFDGTEDQLRTKWSRWLGVTVTAEKPIGPPVVPVTAPHPLPPGASVVNNSNRKAIFDAVRPCLLSGMFSQRQVYQLDSTLDQWNMSGSSRLLFFNLVREMTKSGTFTQSQVDSIDAALNDWETAGGMKP